MNHLVAEKTRANFIIFGISYRHYKFFIIHLKSIEIITYLDNFMALFELALN